MRLRNALWGFGVLFAILFFAVILPAISKTILIANRVVCGLNMEGLLCAMTAYTHDYNGLLPTENWCDLLIEEADVSPKSFVCPGSDAVKGECCYAMNKHIAGMQLSKMPEKMVLFFETDLGRKTGPRSDPIQNRRHYEFLKEDRNGKEAYNKKLMVYKDRFNQLGGPEDLRLRHDLDGQPGCTIVFADGHLEFVTEDRIGELQWKVE